MTRRRGGVLLALAAAVAATAGWASATGTARAGEGAAKSAVVQWSRTRASIDASGRFSSARLSASLSATGRFLVFGTQRCPWGVCSHEETFFVRDLDKRTTKEVVSFPVSETAGGGPAVSPNGHWVAISASAPGGDSPGGGGVWLTNLTTKHVVTLPERWRGAAYRPSFSGDGHYLLYRAAGCRDLALARYNLQSGQIKCARPRTRVVLRYSGQNDVKISDTGRYGVFDSGLRVYRYDFVTRSLVYCNWPDSNTAPSIDDKGRRVLVGTLKGLYLCHFPDGALVTQVDVFPTSAWTYQPQFDPAMSGDGQVVAYRGHHRGGSALFATVLSGGTPTKIADLGAEDSSKTTVMFSRDGTKLAYSDAQGRIWLASR